MIAATAEWLEQVREILGDKPLHVNSWSRCPEHNARVGGEENSYHLRGMAVDITCKHLTPRQVQARLRKHWGTVFGGLGCYAGFSHLDSGPKRTWRG